MFQLKIGIGWSVMELRLIPPTPDYKVWTKIELHKVLWNSELYANQISVSEKKGIFTDTINQLMAAKAPFLERINGESKNVSSSLKEYFRKRKKDECVLISEAEDGIECSKSTCCNQYNIHNAANDDSGVLAQYTPDFETTLKAGESGDWYLNWVQNIVSNEDEINFIDPYLLGNENEERMFKEHYLMMLKPGAKINLHLPTNCDEQALDRIIEYCEDRVHEVTVYLYEPRFMHDRYITTRDMVVAVGVGLDVLDRHDCVRKSTHLHYYRKKEKYLNAKLRYEQEELISHKEEKVYFRE